VAGTIYQAAHYAVFSNILLLLANKILYIAQHSPQTQSTVFPQCPRPSFTPAVTKILRNNTHFYISKDMLSENRKEKKTLQSCSSVHCSKLISSQFFHSAISIPLRHPKILQVSQPSKILNNVSPQSCTFYGVISPLSIQNT
jgi:hypothetical protein